VDRCRLSTDKTSMSSASKSDQARRILHTNKDRNKVISPRSVYSFTVARRNCPRGQGPNNSDASGQAMFETFCQRVT
jgi:hypothetical protein